MIPVRLVMKHFLSYDEPEPIDFTTFQVACLSGPNGVGKSALLDAMTWAVWAKARGCEGGINQDRLIRDGSKEMTVDFTFELGGDRYRIVRRRPRTGSGEVQFLLADHRSDQDGWKNIAGESSKETDEKIERVLRMDYRTFTASAFFLQGRSDDFLSRMKPDERKDVFARLLDLGTYERLEDAARDRARDADRERKNIAESIDRITAALPDITEIETGIAELATTMADVDARVADTSADLEMQRDHLGTLQAADATLQAEREALDVLAAAVRASDEQERAHRTELATIDELLARRDEVDAAVAEAARITEEEAVLRQQQEQAAALGARRAELVARIEGERRTIEQRCAGHRERIAEADAELDALETAKAEIVAIDATLAASVDVAAALTQARSLAESLSADGGRLKADIAQHASAIERSERALAVLADGGGECPVCGTALDAKHRARVKKDITAEIKQVRKDTDAANAALEVARKEAVRCREEIVRLEAAGDERDALLRTREGIRARLDRVGAVTAARTAVTDALAADDVLLATDAFAADARTELSAVDRDLADLYDRDAHEALRARLAELSGYASLAGRIDEAGRGRERVMAAIGSEAARRAELAEHAAAKQAAISGLETSVVGLPDAQRGVADADARLDALRRLSADAAAEQARLQERLAGARSAATELEAARKAEIVAADTHRLYRRLVEAFGPAGIPKLIIDNALPELTADANHILGRLSDHEMSIQFLLERETKAKKASGNVRETFDVLVHHDGGARDFAMFSGGEAFRVAFAVRLAMSKLLVRRSGARLETLVIDEGFGTQDPEGRERLVEAINLAREEFAKVLVITHLEELKDQFGTQIRVDKGIGGSSIALLRS